MIQPSLCQKTIASSWGHLSWLLFHVFGQPGWVLAALSAIALLSLWLPHRRWRRLTLGCSGGLMLLYLLMLSPTVAKAGNRFLGEMLPQDRGQPADAIVVLGRGALLRPERVQVAAKLWREQRAPLVFSSGRGDALEIAAMLKRKGVPAQALDGEPCSATTEENAQFTAAILQPRGIHRIVLVTDTPHMLRSLLTFRSYGFEVTPHASRLSHAFRKPGDGLIVFREWFGLLAYGLMGRYFAREVPAQAPFQQALLPQNQPIDQNADLAESPQVQSSLS